MPSIQTPKTQAIATPKEFFQVIQFGTGADFNHQKFDEYIEKHGEKGREIVRQTRQSFIELIGFKPEELSYIAPEGTFPTSESYETARNQIHERIIDKLDFLKNYAEEKREAGLRRMGTEANNYLDRLIAYYFPGEEAIEMNSEVEICNDAASLTLLAHNDQVDAKVKFEAARKLLLMKFIGEIRNYSRQDEDDDEALHYMMGLFNERILELGEGEKIGSTTPRYLVSHHDPDTFETLKAIFKNEKPTTSETKGLTQVTKLPSRKTIVMGKNGKEREIFFSIDPREKGDESRLTKTLRYGCQIGEKDVDRNGLRLVFEKREDWDDFFRMFKEEVKSEVREGLCEQLENGTDNSDLEEIQARLNDLDSNIEITEEKDSLDGNGFDGNASSSSKDFKICKFKMRVTRADGRQHQYEFQVFLPDGFADAKYRKGVGWEEYHADRFFREEVDKLLFPESIYPELDREEAYKKVMQRAHEKVWDSKSRRKAKVLSIFKSIRTKAKAALSLLPWRKAA